MSFQLTAASGSGRTSVAITSLLSKSSSIDLDAEGTLDWVFLGDMTDTNIPWLLGATGPARKNTGPGDLWRGFSWVYTTGGWISFTQVSPRTFTAASSVNARGDALSSSLGTGFFSHTSGFRILNNGFNLFLPCGRKSRRLMIYPAFFGADITTSARVLNADLDDGKDLIETFTRVDSDMNSLNATPPIAVDFASQSGGVLHVKCLVTQQYTINSNFKVQAFTLAYTP